jgi:hypothetical protein
MAVAADQGRAGQGKAQFGPDDMHDAVPAVAHRHIDDAVAPAVFAQARNLRCGQALGSGKCRGVVGTA